jgi:hypothetical protein
VYGGVQGGARYNGVHKHNGMITFQHEISKYKHDGEIVFGSGLSDRFASDDFSIVLQPDFNEKATVADSLEEIIVTAAMEDREEMDEALTLSVDTDVSDFVDIDDSFVIGMIGYWAYGGADDSPYTHDGSIKFNHGELSYLEL